MVQTPVEVVEIIENKIFKFVSTVLNNSPKFAPHLRIWRNWQTH